MVATAIEIIEEGLAERFGLGPLRAVCDADSDLPIGSSFGCSGTLFDGSTLEFVAIVDEDPDNTSAAITNVTAAGLVGSGFVEDALLSEFVTGPSDEVTCGDEAFRRLDENLELRCWVFVDDLWQVVVGRCRSMSTSLVI